MFITHKQEPYYHILESERTPPGVAVCLARGCSVQDPPSEDDPDSSPPISPPPVYQEITDFASSRFRTTTTESTDLDSSVHVCDDDPRTSPHRTSLELSSSPSPPISESEYRTGEEITNQCVESNIVPIKVGTVV